VEEGIEGGGVASDDDIEPAHLWLGFEDEKMCASVTACLTTISNPLTSGWVSKMRK
jgi:hypothetical protein